MTKEHQRFKPVTFILHVCAYISCKVVTVKYSLNRDSTATMTSNRGRFFSSMMGIHTDSHTCKTSNIQDQTTGKPQWKHTVCHKNNHTSFAMPVSIISEHTGGLWDFMYGLYCNHSKLAQQNTCIELINTWINLNCKMRSNDSISSTTCDAFSSREIKYTVTTETASRLLPIYAKLIICIIM